MNLRNIRLHTDVVCIRAIPTLHCSLLAASQSVSSNDFSFFFAAGFLAMFLFAMRNLVGEFYRNMQHSPSVLPSRCTLFVVVDEN